MTVFTFNNGLLDRNGIFEFYFGAWDPSGIKQFSFDAFIDYSGIAVSRGEKYFLASSIFAADPDRHSLITSFSEENTDIIKLLFRGYLLEPPIHSLSPKEKIADYWKHDFYRNHNGIFSAVAIKNAGNTLEMVTDAFGIAPLYYRKLDTSIIFSSSPRFLSYEADKQNLKAWRCLMESGFIMGNDSLNKEVRRVPPGAVLSFSGNKLFTKSWFDYSALPEGRDYITSKAVDDAEQSFSGAVKRCLKLDAGERLLPLSGGYDSRHILAHLLLNNVSFLSSTVRVPHPVKGYDVDGFFSEAIVREYGLNHSFHRMPAGEDRVTAEKIRRFILDYESTMHAGFLPVWNNPDKSTIVLDGLCGDTLSHSGLKISGIGDNYIPDRRIIAQHLVKCDFDSVLNPEFWPNYKEILDGFIEGINFIPLTPASVDIIVILHRARRAISIASQQFAKSGHIAVYPYLDLDHIKTLLQYHPLERFKTPFQAQCLKQYHSNIYNYHGSHNIPDNLSIPVIDDDPLFLSEHLKTLRILNTSAHLKFLNWKRKFMFKLAVKQNMAAKRITWWSIPLSEFLDKLGQPAFILKSQRSTI